MLKAYWTARMQPCTTENPKPKREYGYEIRDEDEDVEVAFVPVPAWDSAKETKKAFAKAGFILSFDEGNVDHIERINP